MNILKPLYWLVCLCPCLMLSQPAPSAGYDAQNTYEYGGAKLNDLEKRGRDTWYFWTGGGENFWRKVAVITKGTVDLLQYVDSRRRPERFKTMGVINDPNCSQATGPDEYGLYMDTCEGQNVPDMPGRPSGIIGLRRFPNPKFDKAKWNVTQYLADPSTVEPPYMIGMACSVCHIGFNPLSPPADPEKPRWQNLSPAIGNQYFKEGTLFSLRLNKNDFRWHVATNQPAGTSDTSRFATDHINNPNAINSIFHLAYRPTHPELMMDGSTQQVHHILKDGADSIGTAGASLRVYVNIGMCSDYFTRLQDPIFGVRGEQKPFVIAKARKECEDWRNTEERMPAAEAFLKTIGPMHLSDAPGGPDYLKADAAVPRRGKIAFAEHCASCHSSKQPPADIASDEAKRKAWFREAVLKDDFLTNNFLSDDKRYPVTDLGTNFSRAIAANAIRGHVWEQFSSETYKSQPAVGTIRGLYNPIKPSKPIDFTPGGGGRGYYRTPTLVSIWATAPFLHNNSVGLYNADPSVAGRMAAFTDAMEKLMWPDKRPGIKGIARTPEATDLPIEGRSKPLIVPAGIPINLLARIDAPNVRTLRNDNFLSRLVGWLIGRGRLQNALLRRNLAPDFVEDRGHTYGSDLSDEDKRALIEYMKTF